MIHFTVILTVESIINGMKTQEES